MSKEQSLQALSGAASVAQDALHSGQSVAQIQTPVITAVRVAVPRERELVKARVLEEVGADPEGCLYSWTVNDRHRGKQTIEGPSIKLAMVLAREFGNSTVYPQVVSETPTHWNFVATFVDFESGFSTQREFRQRKPTEGKGKMDLERTIDIAFQVGQSKAIRNTVVNALPTSLVKAAVTRAKTGERDSIAKDEATIPTKRKNVVDYFKRSGITQEQLEARAKKSFAEWDAETIVMFRHLMLAIRDGQTSADIEFSSEAPDAAPLDIDDIVGDGQ